MYQLRNRLQLLAECYEKVHKEGRTKRQEVVCFCFFLKLFTHEIRFFSLIIIIVSWRRLLIRETVEDRLTKYDRVLSFIDFSSTLRSDPYLIAYFVPI